MLALKDSDLILTKEFEDHTCDAKYIIPSCDESIAIYSCPKYNMTFEYFRNHVNPKRYNWTKRLQHLESKMSQTKTDIQQSNYYQRVIDRLNVENNRPLVRVEDLFDVLAKWKKYPKRFRGKTIHKFEWLQYDGNEMSVVLDIDNINKFYYITWGGS